MRAHHSPLEGSGVLVGCRVSADCGHPMLLQPCVATPTPLRFRAHALCARFPRPVGPLAALHLHPTDPRCKFLRSRPCISELAKAMHNYAVMCMDCIQPRDCIVVAFVGTHKLTSDRNGHPIKLAAIGGDANWNR